jgi:hypothetical protein
MTGMACTPSSLVPPMPPTGRLEDILSVRIGDKMSSQRGGVPHHKDCRKWTLCLPEAAFSSIGAGSIEKAA